MCPVDDIRLLHKGLSFHAPLKFPKYVLVSYQAELGWWLVHCYVFLSKFILLRTVTIKGVLFKKQVITHL